ncbi:uncharacterized protein LOC129795989 [Lutzomyia longipalpis]|uniref:uncharacterized protein LOC129795989 n=1 Tax=Lutzomyia longipalpis TaxID=7200 RepID=UPI0024842062|nr:uncharacterized protein LOC129795989 [Lutzomyia longipalpis]
MEEVPLLCVNDERRKKRAEEVLKTFKFNADSLSEDLSDDINDTSDCSSKLSDPFSDMEEKIVPQAAAGKRRMTKIEADCMLMSSFTPNFMSVQKEMLNELQTDEVICSDFQTKRNYTYLDRREPKESDERIRRRIQDMLTSCGIKSPAPVSRATESPDKPLSTGAPSPLEMYAMLQGKSPMSDADNSSLSAVWRMLDAQSVENGFPVTPFGYNVFEDKRLEWMTRKESSWNDREDIREKCENWLKNIE